MKCGQRMTPEPFPIDTVDQFIHNPDSAERLLELINDHINELEVPVCELEKGHVNNDEPHKCGSLSWWEAGELPGLENP